MRKRQEKNLRHLFYVLGNYKPARRKALLKHGVDKELINLTSDLYSNLTEGKIHLPEVLKQQKKSHCSIVYALAAKNKEQKFQRQRLLQAVGSYFTIVLPITAGYVNSFLMTKPYKSQ